MRAGGRGWLIVGLALLVAAGSWSLWRWLLRHEPPYATTRLMMGTLVSISTHGVDSGLADRAVGLAFDEMARIEGVMSRFLPSSEVTRLNGAPRGEEQPVSEELGRLLEKGLAFHRLSGGGFDIGLAPLSDLWGFSREPPPTTPPSREAIALWLAARGGLEGAGIDLRQQPEWRVRLADKGVGLDLGGIAKGYAVERALEILRREGVANVLINAGGDMRIAGDKAGTPWRVGLRDPRNPDGVVAVMDLAGSRALSTSGDYERFFMADGVRYHHILDPKSGFSSRSGLISVSVQAGDAVTADGLSTALFVLGEEAGLALLRRFPGCEALLIREDASHIATDGFVGRWAKGP